MGKTAKGGKWLLSAPQTPTPRQLVTEWGASVPPKDGVQLRTKRRAAGADIGSKGSEHVSSEMTQAGGGGGVSRDSLRKAQPPFFSQVKRLPANTFHLKDGWVSA